jgi:Uma2 family endonuclease
MESVKSPAEQRGVLHDAGWDTYERLLADNQNNSAPRFAYDRGELEIMSPSPEHEKFNRRIAQLVLAVGEEMGVPEVWRYDGERMTILVREGSAYLEATESAVLRPATSNALTDLVEKSKTTRRTLWLERVGEWARENTGPSE